ncbi:MAG: HU family DNA-binding protein [Bdellovibrionales bacterium]|nr:HU family DNA-binding protein [Bdellovibrionales bacterium]
MTRSELILEVAQRADLTPRDADKILRIITDIIKERVAAGEKITISGFGTFERRRRKATVARNPKTHEPMRIAEQYVAAFRAGSGLKEAVKVSE